ncbi:hypothetical protein LXL04_035155 [Taraxacum kok-saghyz]
MKKVGGVFDLASDHGLGLGPRTRSGVRAFDSVLVMSDSREAKGHGNISTGDFAIKRIAFVDGLKHNLITILFIKYMKSHEVPERFQQMKTEKLWTEQLQSLHASWSKMGPP